MAKARLKALHDARAARRNASASKQAAKADRKTIADIETARKKKLWREYPSPATKKRYQLVRELLGYAPSANFLDWSRVNRRTTFIWRFPTLRENARWVWECSNAAMRAHPRADKATIVMHYVHKAFGVAMPDLLDDQRNVAIFIPRSIAIVCLKKAGLSNKEISRQMDRDTATIRNAVKRVQHLFEEVQDGPQDTSPSGPASDGEPDRPIPS